MVKRVASSLRYKTMIRLGLSILAVLTVILGITILQAHPPAGPQENQTQKPSREEKRRQKAIREESETPYKKWLTEEVPYIITNEERAAFKKLSTDDEREAFIETFWERRNPNPGSPENEFKEEYYRRIAYANEHYASGMPGWENGSRPHLHYVRPAGRRGFPPQRRDVRAPHVRRRRRHYGVSL